MPRNRRRSTKGSPAAVDPPRRKLSLVLWIMSMGMLVAQIWADYQGWIMGRTDYPYGTFLFNTYARFSDFTDVALVAQLPNPYESTFAVYFPMAYVMGRLFSHLPPALAVFLCLSAALSGLYLLLLKAFAKIVVHPWSRIAYVLLFMGTSYPVLICIDRGNIEIVLAWLIAIALLAIGRGKSRMALPSLLGATLFKPHPVLLLALPLRRRRPGFVVGFLLALAGGTWLALIVLSVSIPSFIALYGRNLAYFTGAGILENHGLEGSASPWNAYKVGLLYAQSIGLIAPVDFSYDGVFIGRSYEVYSAVMGLLALGLVGYVCLVEKEYKRCAAILLIFLAISVPSGGDYRLLYAWFALVPLILLKSERVHDRLALILLALVMVPKKEMLLAFAGRTETGWNDVSIQVLLNPLFLLAALSLLLYDGWMRRDPKWSRQRLLNLLPVPLRRLAFKK